MLKQFSIIYKKSFVIYDLRFTNYLKSLKSSQVWFTIQIL